MKENSDYCGYLCAAAIEQQQAIIDELIDFSKYNPEFAPTMWDKLTKMLYDARVELSSKETLK